MYFLPFHTFPPNLAVFVPGARFHPFPAYSVSYSTRKWRNRVVLTVFTHFHVSLAFPPLATKLGRFHTGRPFAPVFVSYSTRKWPNGVVLTVLTHFHV